MTQQRHARLGEDQRTRALCAARVGLWDWNIPADELTVEQYGSESGAMAVSAQTSKLGELIHADDIGSLLETVYHQTQADEPFEVVLRLRLPSGDWKWVVVRGQITQSDAHGTPIRIAAQHNGVDAQAILAGDGTLPEGMYRTILSNISDTVLITDSKGQFKFICPNIHVIFGYTEHETHELGNITVLLGAALMERIPTNPGEEIRNIELKVKDKYGATHILFVNIKVAPLWGETLLFTCRDITDHRQATQALHDTETRFRIIVNTAHEGICQVDNNNRITYANPHFGEMLGFSQIELVGRPIYDFVDEKFQGQAIQLTQQRKQTGTLQAEVKYRTKDGAPLWGLVVSNNLYDEMGGQVGGLVFITNITLRKMAEDALGQQARDIQVINQDLQQQLDENTLAQKALAESEAALAALINNVNDTIFSIDNERRLVSFNTAFTRRAKERLGLDLFEGMVLAEYFPKPYLDAYFPLFDRVLSGESFTVPMYLQVPSSEIGVYNEVTCNPLYAASGNISGAAIFAREVTESIRAELALRESESRFRRVVENVPLAFSIYDVEHDSLVYLNEIAQQAMQELTGREESTRAQWIAHVHPEDLALTGEIFGGNSTPLPDFVEYRLVFPSGELRHMRHLSFPIAEKDGHVLQVASFIEDITKRKQIEHALEWKEWLLANIVGNLPIGVVVFSLEGRILSVNALCAMYMDHPIELMLDRNIEDIFTAKQREMWSLINARTLESDRIVQYQSSRVRDGVPYTLLIGSFPLHDADGNIFAIGHSMVDITAQIESQEQLRQLSKQIIEVQEKERRHIASELHDEVGQSLTGILLMLNKLERTSVGIDTETISQIQAIVRQLMSQIRELSHSLHPPILDNHGLMSAMQWYCNHYASQTQIQVTFKYTGSQDRLPSDVELACYRVIQEGLTNIARYAQVNQAVVNVSVNQKRVKLLVKDTGIGFDLERVQASNATFGLSGMSERIALLRGTIKIVSSPGKGTSIAVEIPLKSDNLKSFMNNSGFS